MKGTTSKLPKNYFNRSTALPMLAGKIPEKYP